MTTGPAKSGAFRLVEMVNAFQETCVIVAALKMGLFGELAKAPLRQTELARALEVDPRALRRLVRALRVLGLVTSTDAGLSLTATAKLLVDERFTVGDWAALVGDEYLPAWAALGHSVRTGGTGFEHVFKTTAWEHRKQNPDLDRHFNRVTSAVQMRTISALAKAYDFSGAQCIVDVGGGRGYLLAGLLKRLPGVRGVLFDQGHVVAGASFEGLEDRCSAVGGSFLEGVPKGGDIYVMKHCLHNWDDAACVTILKNCRVAMGPLSKLLILEDVLPPDDEVSAESRDLVMMDVHMMTVLGGLERTSEEYAALFRAAGLDFTRTIVTEKGAPDILEAKLVPGAITP